MGRNACPAEYLERGIRTAGERGAELLVCSLTPWRQHRPDAGYGRRYAPAAHRLLYISRRAAPWLAAPAR
jgi:hypothetical protein